MEGPRDSETLPANVVDPFPFSLTNPWQNLEQWRLCGYYDGMQYFVFMQPTLNPSALACFIREKTSNLALYHWEALHDQVGEKREIQHAPFIYRQNLW